VPVAADPLDDATPSDTLAAVLLLLSEVSEMTTDAPKIIFKHQIYTIVEDRTSVDREVDRLCKNNQAQIFKFGPISDECVRVVWRQSRPSAMTSRRALCHGTG